MVRIPPLAAVHTKKKKKATLVGTFILQILFHRKDREPLEERTLQKDVTLKLPFVVRGQQIRSSILHCSFFFYQ